MTDLEQQIKAWADTTMAEVEGPSAAPEPTPTRGWTRPLAVAVVLALVAIGAVVVGRSNSDEVRTGPPPTIDTTTKPGALPPEIPFKLLTSRPAEASREGTLAAAYTQEQLLRLWKDRDPRAENRGEPQPVPRIDFDRQVVVSMILSNGACAELAGFVHGSGRAFTHPRFGSTDPECRGGPFVTQYIAAIDWSDLANSPWLELPADGEDGDRPQLRLRQSRPWLVTVDLEVQGIPSTVTVGDEILVNVVVNNATGRPLRVGYCGEPFALGLRRDGTSILPVQLLCLQHLDIPTGQSIYEVPLSANRMGCSLGAQVPVEERCQQDGSPRPLEPGEYEIVLQKPSGFEATPPPQTITLVE